MVRKAVNFITQLRDRWTWWRHIYAAWPTWAVFSDDMRKQDQISYRRGFDDGYHKAMQDIRAVRMGKAANN